MEVGRYGGCGQIQRSETQTTSFLKKEKKSFPVPAVGRQTPIRVRRRNSGIPVDRSSPLMEAARRDPVSNQDGAQRARAAGLARRSEPLPASTVLRSTKHTGGFGGYEDPRSCWWALSGFSLFFLGPDSAPF
jgi:hypothetical protein